MRYIYFQIHVSHQHPTHKYSHWELHGCYRPNRISTISHNAYPDNLAPTEENHINRISLVSCCYLQLLPYSQKSAAWTYSINHVYKTSHMIVVYSAPPIIILHLNSPHDFVAPKCKIFHEFSLKTGNTCLPQFLGQT